MLSGTGLCDEKITRPEECYRLWCVVVCDLENLKNEETMTGVGSQRHKKKKNHEFPYSYVCSYTGCPISDYLQMLQDLTSGSRNMRSFDALACGGIQRPYRKNTPNTETAVLGIPSND